MSASLPGNRSLPESRYDLGTYWGRVRHAADISDPRNIFAGSSGLERAKQQIIAFKTGKIREMTPELWKAKKILDSTLHPDTGEPVFLPFRMSCFVFSNLVVTAGMLIPGLGTLGTMGWQVANQSLNVAINSSNANKSSPLTTAMLAKSFTLAVGASCAVAAGLKSLVPRIKAPPRVKLVADRLVPFFAVVSAGVVNVYVMRAEERRLGIDVFPAQSPEDLRRLEAEGKSVKESVQSIGKSRIAADRAVRETAISRVINATPIMVVPPLVLMMWQRRSEALRSSMRRSMLVNCGVIGITSLVALPLALAVFPSNRSVPASELEPEFHGRGGADGMVTFNRGL